MQADRGDNRDKIFPKYRESIERAKKLDEANKDPNQPSLLMREKKMIWPFPFGFLNTLKEEVRWYDECAYVCCDTRHPTFVQAALSTPHSDCLP